MEPVLELVGVSRIHHVARERQRGQILLFSQLLLLFSKHHLVLQQLQFIEVGVESAVSSGVGHVGVVNHNGNLLVEVVVEHILEHIVLLLKHRASVVVLHLHVFDVEVHALHVHFNSHAVVEERHGDVAQLLHAANVVVHQSNLFLGVLRHKVHLANLHDKVLLGFFIRQLVDVVNQFSQIHCGERHLVVERHLQLHAGSGIILQSLGDVVFFAVSSAVGHRHRRREIVVERSHRIDLRQQSRTIFADGELSFFDFSLSRL